MGRPGDEDTNEPMIRHIRLFCLQHICCCSHLRVYTVSLMDVVDACRLNLRISISVFNEHIIIIVISGDLKYFHNNNIVSVQFPK